MPDSMNSRYSDTKLPAPPRQHRRPDKRLVEPIVQPVVAPDVLLRAAMRSITFIGGVYDYGSAKFAAVDTEDYGFAGAVPMSGVSYGVL